jgi:hypothetical protein
MRAILYLIRKKIKNGVLDLFRHPAKLITYLAFSAFLIFTVLSGTRRERSGTDDYMDMRILHGIYLSVLLFIGVPGILTGVKSGTTFFKMSDVNILFVSPISPKKILAYGLLKQMGSSLLMMVFLMFYAGMARASFGVTTGQMVTLVAGVALAVFMMQLLVLLIYSFSSGRAGRVRGIKIAVYAILGSVVAFVFSSFLLNGSNMEALLSAISSPYLELLPVFGWIKGMIFAIISGNTMYILLYAILNVLTIAASILLFVKSDSDYYEDVLQTTESTFAMKKAVEEGRWLGMNAANAKSPKVKDTGINHGWGANTFFFKHLRQAKRASRIPFMKTSTAVLLAVNLILVIAVQRVSSSEGNMMQTGYLMGIALAVSSYMLFIFNAAGDWTIELMKPYIYLVPEKPFTKLLWATMSTIAMPVIEGALVFTLLCVVLRANPATALICMLIYASMGFAYTAVLVLSERVLGHISNKGLILILYLLLLGIILAPGIAGSAVLYAFARQVPGIVMGLPILGWNLLVSVGIFYACRNLLTTVEFSK